MNHPILTTTAIGLSLMTTMSTADVFHPISDLATPGMVNGIGVGQELNIIQGAGVGFDANLPHDNIGANWYTNQAGSNYIDVHAGDEKLLFDLGADVVLGEISVWGYAATNGNGLREFNVSFATEAEGGDPALGDELYGNSITLNPSYTAALDPTPRQSFRFGEPITARYVEVWVTSNYAPFLAGGDRLGVGEIAFAAFTVAGEPDIEVADVDFAFSSSLANYSVPVTNTGEFDLNVSNATFGGTHGSAFSVASNPGPIGTWETANIEIQFDPVGLNGAISATMTIPSDDPDESSVEILITGVVGPVIQVASPANLALESTVATYDIDIENTGSSDLTISGTSFTGANAASFSATVVPTTIAPGVIDVITIQFDPTGLEPGQIEATLQIMSNDSVTPTVEVVIIGGVPHSFFPITDVYTNTVNFYPELNLIDGPGLGFDERWPHNSIGGSGAATWVTDAPNGGASYYNNDQPAPVLEFDLGQDRPLSEISTWGYDNGNTNGGKDFSLRFATAADGEFGFGTSITYNPSFEAAFNATTRDSHLFSQTVTARYVEMTITTNWRDLQPPLAGGDRVGLGEVAFEDRPAIIPAPPFDVLSVAVGATNVDLTFESIEHVIYNLERSVDGTTWDLLPDTAVGGAGATTVISDTNPVAEAVVLYRVINTGQMIP